MDGKLKRGFAGASALGAALFIGLFWWLYATGIFPLGLTAILSLLNLVVGVASLKLVFDK
jgi:hypothetical protein